MEVWMLWHGGSSYAVGEIPADLERFDSLRDAKRAFDARADFDPYYPCVERDESEDGGPSAWVFFAHPGDDGDPYPDRVIEYGPRGGLRVTAG